MLSQLRWININNKKNFQFVSKDVYALHNDVYILFHNLNSHLELIYSANSSLSGEGIECFSGDKTLYMFTFAEKSTKPRLIVLTYPEFKIITILKDDTIRRYAALEMTESERIIAISNAPSCKIIVWCWRTEVQLISYDTKIEYSKHILRSNFTQNSFCHFWNKKLTVWDIIPMHTSCALLSKPLYDDFPRFEDFTWTNEGLLFALDKDLNLFSITNDGLCVIAVKEWSPGELSEFEKPLLVFFKNGLIVHGKKSSIQFLKKKEKNWVIDWDYSFEESIIALASNYLNDIVVCVLESGNIFKLSYENDQLVCTILTYSTNNIIYFDFINPGSEKLITINSEFTLCIWNCINGRMKAQTKFENNIYAIKSSPTDPILAICCGINNKNGLSLIKVDNKIENMVSKCLTDQIINQICWNSTGKKLLAFNCKTRQVFLVEVSKYVKNETIEVIYFLEIDYEIKHCWICTFDYDEYLILLLNNKGMTVKAYDTQKKQESHIIYAWKEEYIKIAVLTENNNLLGFSENNDKFEVYELIKKNNIIVIQPQEKIYNNIEEIINLYENEDYYWNKTTIDILNSCLEFSPGNRFFNFGINISNIKISSEKTIIAALSEDNDLMSCSNIKNLKNILTEKNILNYDGCKIEPVTFCIFDKNTETWLEQIKLSEDMKILAEWSDVQNDIKMKYSALKNELTTLINKNYSSSTLVELPLDLFRLDFDDSMKFFEIAEKNEKDEKLKIEKRIMAQDKVTEWIKHICWDSAVVVGTELHSMFTNKKIENYVLLKPTNTDYVNCSKMLKSLEDPPNNYFMEYFEAQIKSNLKTSKDIFKFSTISGENINNFNYEFMPLLSSICSQILQNSFLDMNWQAINADDSVYNLQHVYNKKFEQFMEMKIHEINVAKQRGARLEMIISELNQLRALKGNHDKIEINLKLPTLMNEETPINFTKVENKEVCISPYRSSSSITKSEEKNSIDNTFHETTLIEMMDGSLEKKWYEEIKREIPKPVCMIEKDEDELTEFDLSEIKEWQILTKEREGERVKYGKSLYNEFFELSKAYNESILEFNSKFFDLFKFKLEMDFIIAQEEFKHMLCRVNNLNRIEAAEKLKELETELLRVETEQEHVSLQLNDIHNELNECHGTHENLVVRDRLFEKNFKLSFPDITPIAIDLCYKAFKKRPKWQIKSSATAGALIEMAQACLTKEKPRLLNADCIEYLIGIDQLDLITQMPPIIDESTWISTCKLRRVKIDNEIKIKAALAEIADTEMAYVTWQRKHTALRSLQQKLKTDIINQRGLMEMQAKNKMLMFMMKSGAVEIEMTGHLEDFKNTILIRCEEIEEINNKIKEAKEVKDAAEIKNIGFRKHLLTKEWEHATLKTKLTQLENELHYFQRIKITKEIKDYIKNKSLLKYNKDDIEKKLQITKLCFEKELLTSIRIVEELEMKIQSFHPQDQDLDNTINRLEKELAYFHKKEDEEKEHKRGDERRMNAMVAKNNLISKVHQQHSTILQLQTELELQRLKTYPTLSSSI